MPIWESRMLKINVFICDILLSQTDASHLPAVKHNCSGGALELLRSGLVQTGCQKSGKTTADISDNARGGALYTKEITIFRGVIQGQRYRMIPSQCTNSRRQMIK